MVMWGLWGFFAKLATNYIPPMDAYIFEISGMLLVGIVTISLLRFRPTGHPQGMLFATLAGIVVGIGTILFFFAVSRGRSSVVVTVTALYPLVTLLLGFLFLQEPLTMKQLIGIGFALLAIILLST